MRLILGDCIEVLKQLEDNSVDSIVTDPPYGLGFMGKEWDTFDKSQFGQAGNEGENDLKVKKNFNILPRYNSDGLYDFSLNWAKECFRVLKPGGHILAFAGTRTYHKIASAIEDAGFEIRDMIEWVYGSGFPKSLNIGKAVDKLQGNEREVLGEKETKDFSHHKGSMMGKETTPDDKTQTTTIIETKGTSEWEGWGTALKPAHEPIALARKPLSEKSVAENVLKHGTGGLNIDGSRVGTEVIKNNQDQRSLQKWKEIDGRKHKEIENPEPTYNVGRFPANLIHDNSEEVRECFPETKPTKPHGGDGGKLDTQEMGWGFKRMPCDLSDNGGNASRFFKSIIYTAKASKSERNMGCEGLEEKQSSPFGSGGCGNQNPPAKMSNNHPTVKPVALMEYLIKMITPPKGIVLDPFMGSGSTGVAAIQNGYDFIGIEKEPEYIKIAEARINKSHQRKLL